MKYFKTTCLVLALFGIAAAAHAESYRTVEFMVQADKRAEFVDLMKVALVDTRNFEGAKHIAMLVAADDPQKVLIYEIWETDEHYQAYSKWRTDTDFASTVGPFLAGPPKGETYMLAE
jgi:quinol monooxygenase YgiN